MHTTVQRTHVGERQQVELKTSHLQTRGPVHNSRENSSSHGKNGPQGGIVGE